MNKIFAVALACVLVCVCVTGCAVIPSDTSDNSTASQESTTTTTNRTTSTATSRTTTTTTAIATTTTTTTATTSTTIKITTTAATVAQNTVEAMVWIPQSGTKYHSKASCSNMKNPSQVSISDAINAGYKPCKRCYK